MAAISLKTGNNQAVGAAGGKCFCLLDGSGVILKIEANKKGIYELL